MSGECVSSIRAVTSLRIFIQVTYERDLEVSTVTNLRIYDILNDSIRHEPSCTLTNLLSIQIITELIERITQKKDNVSDKQASTFLMGGVAHNARTAQGDSSAATRKMDGYLGRSICVS
jgi:hypothetical protein